MFWDKVFLLGWCFSFGLSGDLDGPPMKTLLAPIPPGEHYPQPETVFAHHLRKQDQNIRN